MTRLLTSPSPKFELWSKNPVFFLFSFFFKYESILSALQLEICFHLKNHTAERRICDCVIALFLGQIIGNIHYFYRKSIFTASTPPTPQPPPLKTHTQKTKVTRCSQQTQRRSCPVHISSAATCPLSRSLDTPYIILKSPLGEK